MCYIADMVVPDNDGQGVCAFLRIDSVNSLQRMAAVNVTYGYGQKYMSELIIDELFGQTALFPKDIMNVADILVGIMGGVPNLVSAGAIYMCGAKACHITTGREIMDVVRKGRLIKACRKGIDNSKGTDNNGKFRMSAIRLKKNDTVILNERLLYDKDTAGYVCDLISLNQKRRAAHRAYKGNSEILDMICGAVKLSGGNPGSVLTVITCVSDI